MSDTKGILFAGVGGQGTLLASRILGAVLLGHGYDIKMSEVHGMAQRGGSVVTYVKYGERVYSPLIDVNEAEYILGFEQLETARWLPCLKEGGTLIVNDRRISPMPVLTGAMPYPEDVVKKIRAKGVNTISADALAMAAEAGNGKSVNVVLIGILSSLLDFPLDSWEKALAESVKPEFLEINRKAFYLGREFGEKSAKG